MKVKVFQAAAGDALLIESTSAGAPKVRILVDGGEPKAYDRFLAGPLSDVDRLDVVYVSHIDRDHIGGILELLDATVEWKLFDKIDGRSRPATPRPPAVGAIWHNAFFDEVHQNTPAIVNALSGTGALALGHRDAAVRDAGAHMADLAQSVGDAILVSRRIGDNQLDIALNPDAGGDFLLRKAGFEMDPVGPLVVHILGPTVDNLRGLIDDWNEWLQSKADYLARLIAKQEADEDLLASDSGTGPLLVSHQQADDLVASGGRVTPPNVASLMVMLEEPSAGAAPPTHVLLTGDADDVDILDGLRAGGHMNADDRIHVAGFKVPHHGAANSFSLDLATKVTADNYIFCGNGDNDNPEIDVVRGYIEARRMLAAAPGAPPEHKRAFKLWFNHSEHEAIDEEDERVAQNKTRNQDRIDHWTALEAMVDGFVGDGERPAVKARFLKRYRSMTFTP